MSTQVNKTVVGIFMVSAIALLVAAVLILGSGKFFKHLPKYVMFFKGSVAGLSVGSPVLFRGVKVGEVKEIKLSFNPKDLSANIPVIVELGQAKVEVQGETADGPIGEQKGMIQKLIDKGFRGQLGMQSFVTGQMMITLDLYPGSPAVFVGTEPKYTEIPTIPTPIQELTRKLEKLPIEDIFKETQQAMTAISKIVNSPELAAMLRSISEGVSETRILVKNVDRQIGPAGTNVNEAVREVKKLASRLEGDIGPLMATVTKAADEAGIALKRSHTVLGNAEGIMAGDSPMGYRLMKSLEEFEAAARSMRTLADTLDQHPEMLIYGKKGTKEAAR